MSLRESNWGVIETFCERMADREEIWYATNVEIYEYMMGLQRLQITANSKSIYNPSTMTLWFSCDGETVKINGGETLSL